MENVGTGSSHLENGASWVRAACADGVQDPIVQKLGSLGAWGKHPQNSERDLYRFLRSELKLEPYTLNIELELPEYLQPQMVKVGALPIHEFIAALSSAGPLTFQTSLLGAGGESAVEAFWRHAMNMSCYKQHPALQDPCRHPHMIPLVFHVDGAEVYTNQEFYFWQWSSLLAKGSVFDTKFPILCVPHACMKKNRIKQAVMKHVADFISWSLLQCEKGEWPMCGFYGEPFEKGSIRAARCGQTLAGSWTGCFAGFKCDLKARAESHGFLQNYGCTFLCECCKAQQPFKRANLELNCYDFTDDARWRGTVIGTAEYLQQVASPSPWTAVRGWCLELNWQDDMHNFLLGTLKDHCASAMLTLLQDGLLGEERDADLRLKRLWLECRDWCKTNKLKAPRSQALRYMIY